MPDDFVAHVICQPDGEGMDWPTFDATGGGSMVVCFTDKVKAERFAAAKGMGPEWKVATMPLKEFFHWLRSNMENGVDWIAVNPGANEGTCVKIARFLAEFEFGPPVKARYSIPPSPWVVCKAEGDGYVWPKLQAADGTQGAAFFTTQENAQKFLETSDLGHEWKVGEIPLEDLIATLRHNLTHGLPWVIIDPEENGRAPINVLELLANAPDGL